MEGRILHLNSVLENCEILDSADAAGADAVRPGVVVEIRFEGDSITEKYLFGSIEERRDGLEVVSPGSPMGQALDGGRAGETVSYEAGGNELRVEIVAIDS